MEVFLVSQLKCMFKDAQTPARLVECQEDKQSSLLSIQIWLLMNCDPVFTGTSGCASASVLPRLLSSGNCFFSLTCRTVVIVISLVYINILPVAVEHDVAWV